MDDQMRPEFNVSHLRNSSNETAQSLQNYLQGGLSVGSLAPNLVTPLRLGSNYDTTYKNGTGFEPKQLANIHSHTANFSPYNALSGLTVSQQQQQSTNIDRSFSYTETNGTEKRSSYESSQHNNIHQLDPMQSLRQRRVQQQQLHDALFAQQSIQALLQAQHAQRLANQMQYPGAVPNQQTPSSELYAASNSRLNHIGKPSGEYGPQYLVETSGPDVLNGMCASDVRSQVYPQRTSEQLLVENQQQLLNALGPWNGSLQLDHSRANSTFGIDPTRTHMQHRVAQTSTGSAHVKQHACNPVSTLNSTNADQQNTIASSSASTIGSSNVQQLNSGSSSTLETSSDNTSQSNKITHDKDSPATQQVENSVDHLLKRADELLEAANVPQVVQVEKGQVDQTSSCSNIIDTERSIVTGPNVDCTEAFNKSNQPRINAQSGSEVGVTNTNVSSYFKCCNCDSEWSHADIDELKSSISYCEPRRMKQQWLGDVKALPGIMIRPPALEQLGQDPEKIDTERAIQQMYHSMVESKQVSAIAVSTQSSEANMKQYLELCSIASEEGRVLVVENNQCAMGDRLPKFPTYASVDEVHGSSFHHRGEKVPIVAIETLDTFNDILPRIGQDNLFWAMHYRYVKMDERKDGDVDTPVGPITRRRAHRMSSSSLRWKLEPVVATTDTTEATVEPSGGGSNRCAFRTAVPGSDVVVGFMVRRGTGGTGIVKAKNDERRKIKRLESLVSDAMSSSGTVMSQELKNALRVAREDVEATRREQSPVERLLAKRNKYTYSIRLEVYVGKSLWSHIRSTEGRQSELLKFVNILELHIAREMSKCNISAEELLIKSSLTGNGALDPTSQFSGLKHPLYLIATRDCFSYNLVPIRSCADPTCGLPYRHSHRDMKATHRDFEAIQANHPETCTSTKSGQVDSDSCSSKDWQSLDSPQGGTHSNMGEETIDCASVDHMDLFLGEGDRVSPVCVELKGFRCDPVFCEPALKTEKEVLNVDEKVELSLDQKAELSLDQKAEMSLDQKAEMSLDQKAELSLDQKAELSLDQKAELSLDQKVAINLDQKAELSLDQKAELSLDQKAELSLDQKAELSLDQNGSFKVTVKRKPENNSEQGSGTSKKAKHTSAIEKLLFHKFAQEAKCSEQMETTLSKANDKNWTASAATGNRDKAEENCNTFPSKTKALPTEDNKDAPQLEGKPISRCSPKNRTRSSCSDSESMSNSCDKLVKRKRLGEHQTAHEENHATRKRRANQFHELPTRNCAIDQERNQRPEKVEWFFDDSDPLPKLYEAEKYPRDNELGLHRVGITTYLNIFSKSEIMDTEEKTEQVYHDSLGDTYRPMTAHHTIGRTSKISRTKLFFNARYLWTRAQLSSHDAHIARGIRTDVSKVPSWIPSQVEKRLVERQILPKGYVNSYACNIYHDGSEGLGQHFDDQERFDQPIFSVRLFSDSRLSFGCKLYGFSNGEFTVPMPRGSSTVLEKNSYASTQVKHCIRPCDMTTRSGVLLFRHIHDHLIEAANQYEVDTATSYFKSINLNSDVWDKGFFAEHELKQNLLAQGNKNTSTANGNTKQKEPNVARVVKRVMDSMLRSVEREARRHRTCNAVLNVVINKVVRRFRKEQKKRLSATSESKRRKSNSGNLKLPTSSDRTIRAECRRVLKGMVSTIFEMEKQENTIRKVLSKTVDKVVAQSARDKTKEESLLKRFLLRRASSTSRSSTIYKSVSYGPVHGCHADSNYMRKAAKLESTLGAGSKKRTVSGIPPAVAGVNAKHENTAFENVNIGGSVAAVSGVSNKHSTTANSLSSMMAKKKKGTHVNLSLKRV